jgi:hypothetical protein
MGHTATIEVLLGVVIALIPASILLMLLFLWLRALGRRRGDEPSPIEEHSEPLRVMAEPLYDARYPTAEPAQRETHESADAIASKIEKAIASGEKSSLSPLYLELAASHARQGNLDAQMAALRSAAGHGALHGPHAAHAAARLALGEAAHQSGDLTSACEQWQLARTAFEEGGDAEQHARVEKRMRENGCPTDWVLTDF